MWNNFVTKRRTLIQYGLSGIASFAVLSWLHIRPLGIFFLSLFGLWVYKTRCNLRILPPPELQSHIEKFMNRLRDWRQANKTMFCLVTSGALGALAVLGHYMSGSTIVLIGLVLSAIISTKYNFQIVKVERKDFSWADKLQQDLEIDDEFMPEVNETNLFVLERAGDLASISLAAEDNDSEEKSDDISSELLIPDSIPEIDETDEEDEDLLPIVKDKPQQQQKHSTEIFASTSDSQIEFRKGHFKRDSSLSTTSSSSEESLSKGLQFPDHTSVDGPSQRQIMPAEHNLEASDVVAMAIKSQTQALLSNSGKILPTLVSGIVQWAGNASAANAAKPEQRVVTALDSSDESDFEILDNDDFK